MGRCEARSDRGGAGSAIHSCRVWLGWPLVPPLIGGDRSGQCPVAMGVFGRLIAVAARRIGDSLAAIAATIDQIVEISGDMLALRINACGGVVGGDVAARSRQFFRVT